jgi:hypothetical protein
MNIRLLVLVFVLAAAMGCRRDQIVTIEETTLFYPPVVMVNASLHGRVIDENGEGIQGLLVMMEGQTQTTGLGGFFSFNNVPMNKNGAVVRVQANGFFQASKRILTQLNSDNYITLVLTEEQPIAISGTDLSFLGFQTLDGVHLSLSSSQDLVNSAGAVVSGTMQLSVLHFDLLTIEGNRALPGSIAAVDLLNREQALKIISAATVNLVDLTGAPVQFAGGKTATLSLPIPENMLASVPNEVPMWFLEDSTGLWREEGSAVKSSQQYSGNIKKLGTWAFGFPSDPIAISGKLVAANGALLSNAEIWITSENIGCGQVFTDAVGRFAAIAPAGLPLSMFTKAACANTPTFLLGVLGLNTDIYLGELDVDASVYNAVHVSGSILGCDGLTDEGYFYFADPTSTNNYWHYAPNGIIDLNYLSCGGSVNTFMYNYATESVYNATFATVNDSVELGDVVIETCDPADPEFLNFNISGADYMVTTGLSSVQLDTTTRFVWQSGASDSLVIVFPGTTTGNYALAGNGSFSGFVTIASATTLSFSCGTCSDVVVNITEYGLLGEYINGTFSGTMENVLLNQNDVEIPLPNQFITGSFSVTRDQ